jgi:crossover junction endodeoxyribonuclease RuvC
MTNILALDLGTHTGWALLQQNSLGDTQQHGVDASDKGDCLADIDNTQQNSVGVGTGAGAGAGDKANYLVTSGTISFKNDRFQGGGMRYLRFRNWLDEMHQRSGGLTAVYFEEVRRHLGVDAAHVYGGFLATLTAWCEAMPHGLPYQSVPVSHIKRQVTGKGNASKQEVISAVKAKGYQPQDDNEADALALIDMLL